MAEETTPVLQRSQGGTNADSSGKEEEMAGNPKGAMQGTRGEAGEGSERSPAETKKPEDADVEHHASGLSLILIGVGVALSVFLVALVRIQTGKYDITDRHGV
jgi:hypothetical protein